jgi:hypothetical protein
VPAVRIATLLNAILDELTHPAPCRPGMALPYELPLGLASGQVTLTDRLAVILIQPTGSPAMILMKWPSKPTVVEPVKLQATVAAIVKVLAAAQIEYAARRAAGL